MKLLITGFDPFGGEKTNPAIEAVKRLPAAIAGATVVPLEIPTVFGTCAEVVRQAIITERPDVVLSVGQAGGRSALTPERIAINLDDGRIPDNAGFQPVDQPIQPNGPAAYFTQLPVKAMAQAIRQAGLPSHVSTTAGTYVCNHIMYQVQHLRATEFPQLQAGFIHIPFLPEQVVQRSGVPSLSLTDDVRGLTAAIRAIVIAHAD
ncbi:pyroglutamyl-peptidase I [Levilactobacillus brevis]|mgnify:FL=1|jgi:pyroglutamyl-peptidase|uniref:Pyrrolidone-carboxylate peptidase n=2 Tax=Levilactobacillus brevis TaxID=1580 RepID=PCP_LEVBA|nr:pyroglutamyl-peptidase I [Levilactobacillus brevis]Q03P20.1 RecName: Full=Pyrrolidone-carboxylate peptidase; AltName: Full=5-oxoprolyl-peptidase; AltName: Full=Pyroglutamyl-peptidase I; Short=PGP-I; Short=Pyrase [Levilactobacillus brevis ATCC 367]ABJ65052.1 pyroglutamyl-peptidase I. Cysteine peptidase. MEROPS family C15 [Levilactobacillus brevis ATCC 367]ARQ92641.1 pyroglutamyl-peptidase I [Levilactobacillus brevis]ARW51584.1 Pyroglutamyl-peptidase I [Levilactobacillus brevis]KLE29381.1 pyr